MATVLGVSEMTVGNEQGLQMCKRGGVVKYSFVVSVYGERVRADYERFWSSYWNWVHCADTELVLVEAYEEERLYDDLWLGGDYQYVSYKARGRYEKERAWQVGEAVARGKHIIRCDVCRVLSERTLNVLRSGNAI